MPAIPLVRFSKELPAGDLAERNAPENVKTSTLEGEREEERGPDECLVDVVDLISLHPMFIHLCMQARLNRDVPDENTGAG